MANEEKIGYHEALGMLVIILTGKIFLSFPRNMALLGDSAGWIIVLLAGVYSLISFYFIHVLLTRYPSQNIINIAKKVAGTFVGSILGTAIFLFFLSICAMFLRQFAESFILAILPRTPISVVLSIFLLLLIYGTMLGIETLSRVAWFLGPYLVGALMTILIFVLPQASFSQLLPILGSGPIPILKHSLLLTSAFSEILLLGIIAPLVRDKEKVFRIGVIGLIIAIILNTGITALVISTFNYESAKKLIFPILQLTRLISLGEFIQRVEAVFVFLWFFWAGIQLGGLFYGTVTSFAQTFKIKNYRPLIFPIAILVFTISLIPSSMTQAVEFGDYTGRNSLISGFYIMVAFGIPFLLWLISGLKKNFGGNND